MSPRFSCRQTVLRVAYAGCNYLGAKLIVFKHIDDVFDQLHAIMTGVVQPADKGADIGSAGQRSEQGLVQ